MFCTHAQFFHSRQPLNSYCQPVTCNMAIYGVCILLRGSWGLAPQAFRCESMPTPLNLTYILPYDCPCFARMRNSFTSVDLATIDLSTCQPVDLSTCQAVDLSTCRSHFYGKPIYCLFKKADICYAILDILFNKYDIYLLDIY